MINIIDGSITFDSGLVLRKHMQLTEVESKHIKTKDEYGYVSLLLMPQSVECTSFTVRVYFNDMHQLVGLNLVLNSYPIDWGNWSIETEVKRDVEQKEWLLKSIGKPPYKYSWGTVSAEYDQKSAMSSIYINYERRSKKNWFKLIKK